jgi:TonB-dependent Receptor Plug Domain
MLRRYLIFIIFMFSHFAAFSQKETQSGSQEIDKILIKGFIKPLGSRDSIYDALVIDISNKEVFTRTDKKGFFSFWISKSSKGILIRAENYQELQIKIENGKLMAESPFSLEPSPEYGGYGIIRARRKDEVSQNSFQQDELSQLAGTGGDAVRALQTLPSVLPAGAGSADIVVRGGLPGDNSYFYDDLLLPFIFHFGGVETIIPPRMIESMDFYPGAFSARYTDTIGGVIQLRSPGSIPQRTSGEFELGLIQSGIYLEGNAFTSNKENELAVSGNSKENDATKKILLTSDKDSDGIGYRLGFRRTYLELYKPIIQKLSDNSSFVTIPQATDYQLVLNGNHSKGTWQAYLLGAIDKVSLSAPIGNSTTASGQNNFSFYNSLEVTGVRYNLNLNNGLGLRFTFEQRYFVWQQNILGSVVDARSNLFGLGIMLDKKINDMLSFTVGIRPKYVHNQVGIDVVQYPSGNPTVYFDPDLAPIVNENVTMDQFYGDTFIDILFSPVKSVKINPGINVLQGPVSNQTAVDPRVGLRYEFVEGQTLKLAWGYYSQLPDVQYTAPGYGNPHLDLERSIQYVLGLESKFFENYSSDVQVWYKTSNNLVGPAVNNPNDKYENSIQSRAKGIEILIKKKPSDYWFGWISYGISSAQQRDPGSGIWRYTDYDRTHSINVVYGQKITSRWNAGGRFQFTTGTPYSSVSGGTYNQNTGAYAPVPDGNTYLIDKNDARNSYFMEVDFRTEYDFLFKDWTLTSYLDIFNLLNRSNVAYTTFNRDYSNTIQVSGLPIIPSVGIIAKF